MAARFPRGLRPGTRSAGRRKRRGWVWRHARLSGRSGFKHLRFSPARHRAPGLRLGARPGQQRASMAGSRLQAPANARLGAVTECRENLRCLKLAVPANFARTAQTRPQRFPGTRQRSRGGANRPERGRTMRRGVRLAIDWGDARIGVAACDPDGVLAYPVTTVRAGEDEIAELGRGGRLSTSRSR